MIRSPRLGIAAHYDEFLRLHAERGCQLTQRAGLRPRFAVLESLDRVVGDAGALLQLLQGQNPPLPQFPELHRVHLRHADSVLL